MLFSGLLISTLILTHQRAIGQKDYVECQAPYEFSAIIKGEITSPGYQNGLYPDEINCVYHIQAPEGYRIKITFLDLDIELAKSCGNDNLIIQGKYSNGSQSLLGFICGQVIPKPILSLKNQNFISIIFTSDFMKGGRGFRLQYESSPYFEQCEKGEDVCFNKNCFTKEQRCNGVDDCGDGTDEEDCGRPIATSEECGQTPIEPLLHDSQDRQVGGVETVPNSWPWQVSLQFYFTEVNSQFCGGALINPEWVLTAAHCAVFGRNNPRFIRIVVGSHERFKKTKYEQIRMAKKVVSYPYLEGNNLTNFTLSNDIALIKLNAPVTFNDGVQPVCLPKLGWNVEPGSICYSTGWGQTRGTGNFEKLKQTQQVILSRENCDHTVHNQICVHNNYKSPCHGDSGGPLSCKVGSKWYLMGAVSRATRTNLMGSLCGMPENKTIFVKVADYIDWIAKITGAFA